VRTDSRRSGRLAVYTHTGIRVVVHAHITVDTHSGRVKRRSCAS
jgi:hypothetical protein